MTAPPPALNEYDVALDVLAAQVGQAAKDNAILSAKLRSEQVRSQHLQDQLNAAAAPADTEKGKG